MAAADDRTPTDAAAERAGANRAQMQGLGAGQRDMDAQRDPNRAQSATAPEARSFTGDLEATADDPSGDDPSGDARMDDGGEPDATDRNGLDPTVSRNAAGLDALPGDLGAGTPANVDIHDLGQDDKPEQAWGEPAPDAVFSSNHTRRGVRTEAERGQGAKTRQANKDAVSRRN